MAAGLPSSHLVEVQLNGSWTDITTYVTRWTVRIGSDGGPQPGTLTLDLDNSDGRFVPDNATSTYFPYFVEGVAVRVTVAKTTSGYILPGARPFGGALTSSTGTSSVRFYGWVTGITPEYPANPADSTCQVTAVDTLGVMQRTALKPYPRRGVESSASCVGYFPLTETAARGGGGDTKGNLPDLTVRVVSSGGTCDFASDESFSVDTDPCVSMTSGRGLWHARTQSINLSGAWQVHGLFRLTAGSSGTPLRCYIDRSASGDVILTWNGTDTISSNDLGAGVISITGVSPDSWHYIAVTKSALGSVSMVVDSVSEGIAIGFGSSNVLSAIALGGDLTMSVRDVAVTSGGSFADAYRRSTGITANTLAGVATDLEFTWTTSPTTAATNTTSGKGSHFDALLRAANSQAGRAWCAYTSSSAPVTVLANADARPTTPALTVDAEADVDGGPVITRGLADVVGSVTATSPIGEVVVPGSTGNLGATTVEVETLLANDYDLRAKAEDVAARSLYNRQRVTSLTVDLATAANDLYSAFFNVQVGERLRLTGLPSTYFGVTYLDGLVDGWSETATAGATYTATFDLSPADAPTEGVYDTSRYAFGDGVATNSGTATSSATSMTLTWTGSATLSTDAGDYPLDLDWNGERVTVTSAPAGSTSPQTLTITRGIAPTVARAHASGEPVDVWDAARYTT